MKKRIKINIVVQGIELDVEYYPYKGYRETREQPGEPDFCEIYDITINGSEDLTEVLSDRFLELVEEAVCEYHFSE